MMIKRIENQIEAQKLHYYYFLACSVLLKVPKSNQAAEQYEN